MKNKMKFDADIHFLVRGYSPEELALNDAKGAENLNFGIVVYFYAINKNLRCHWPPKIGFYSITL